MPALRVRFASGVLEYLFDSDAEDGSDAERQRGEIPIPAAQRCGKANHVLGGEAMVSPLTGE